MEQEKIVNQLNNLIEVASKNGGDMGGSYNQCPDDLYEEIQNAMELFELDDAYEIIETYNYGCFSPYKISKGLGYED